MIQSFYTAVIGLITLLGFSSTVVSIAQGALRAGAAAVDISPRTLPAIRNGMFTQTLWDRVDDPLHARCLVLSDGGETIAIAIVDSCMFPTDVCDSIKSRVTQQIGLPANRILISATHTHSAPSVMSYCLGSGRDEAYTEFIVPRVAEAIVNAHQKMQPAKIGWTAVDAGEFTNCRRWITRSDRLGTDPFGEQTVRAMMHPGYQNPNYVSPSGPIDPQLSVLSVVTAEGRPMCLMANYSMHYFGSSDGFSADYFGEVANLFESGIAEITGNTTNDFVGIMSQGTSGDLHWMNYAQPQRSVVRQDYAQAIADRSLRAWKQIEHRADVTLSMAESRIKLRRRVPDSQRLLWAKNFNDARGDQPPRNQQEVYAQQAAWIHADPEAQVVLQAVRIGDLGITALPNEVYAITGLKLKRQSPLSTTFNLELANGAEGYIPPPEQHRLGGYTTWPARTAGLEVGAEPKIVETVLSLLESVSGQKRREHVDPPCAYSRAVAAANPSAYWRLGDINSDRAQDETGQHDAEYRGGVALYLPGPDADGFDPPNNRCVYFAGGSLRATVPALPSEHSLSFCFWHGLSAEGDKKLGTLYSRGEGNRAESLSIVGKENGTAALVFESGTSNKTGTSPVATKAWHHLTVVRSDKMITVSLDGQPELEVSLQKPENERDAGNSNVELTFGDFDGKLDEIAIFDRALSPQEIAEFYRISALAPPTQPEPSVTLDEKPQQPTVDSLDEPKPTTATASLGKIHVRDGYEVQLVACEPQIKDPVALDFAPDGSLWVVEMADYPLGMDGNGKPGGRVRVLRDNDHDGRYESSKLFAEGLPFPTGILVWRKGVLVTAAPEIVYLEDSDGDGQADVRQTLFSGFLEGNQQLRVNGLRWGLDNWVHCASGSHHSGYGKDNRITSVLNGSSHEIGSRDFRIRPDTGEIDPQSGPSQYGRNRDDWGNWFGVQNSRPLWHYVLADEDIRRNPYFAPPDPERQVVTPLNPPVYPASVLEKRFHSFEQSGHFTSACSAIIYRDEVLFPRVNNEQHAFTCEPFHNLVQHNIIFDDGVSFGFRRDPAEAKVDFFASEDRWCRPVMVRTGPDGGLWVVDMYRYMIEHPEWLPQNGQDELLPFYRFGEDQGRIYRVVRTATGEQNSTSSREQIDLSVADTQQLVAALESPNGWQRDMAQRMLVQRDDASAIGPLRSLASSSDHPLARIHALCTLDGMDALEARLLNGALSDTQAGVRRQAVRLAASRPVEVEILRKLVDDSDAKVRLQLAATLGEFEQPLASIALAELAANSAEDPYIISNVMSSLNERNVENVVMAYMKETAGDTESSPTLQAAQRFLLQQLFGQVAAMGQEQAVTKVVGWLCRRNGELQPRQLLALADLLDGLQRREFPLASLPQAEQNLIEQAIEGTRSSITESTDQLTPTVAAAIRLRLRQPAVFRTDLSALSKLLSPQSSVELQRVVVDRLAEQAEPDVADILLASWPSFGPDLRSRVLDTLSSRTVWSRTLLAQVDAGIVLSSVISPVARERLLATSDASLKERWERAFSENVTSDRAAVIEKFTAALRLSGDGIRGEKLFRARCSACHRLNNVGFEVGPNLASITDKRSETLLSAMLDPSAAVEARYLTYIALTKDGRILSGLLATETGSSITLLTAEGKRETILRQEIDELRASKKSLMPDGLELEMSPQDVADIIQLLKSQL